MASKGNQRWVDTPSRSGLKAVWQLRSGDRQTSTGKRVDGHRPQHGPVNIHPPAHGSLAPGSLSSGPGRSPVDPAACTTSTSHAESSVLPPRGDEAFGFHSVRFSASEGPKPLLRTLPLRQPHTSILSGVWKPALSRVEGGAPCPRAVGAPPSLDSTRRMLRYGLRPTQHA